MGKKIAKGERGDAANYVTRSSALKKLKLTLKEFRRLCILKGIFPKEPKKKFKGQNKTYFLLKDIKYLSHERLINKFREINAFRRKIKKAKAKSMKFNAKSLKKNVPTYSLSHIIRERYPRFKDALNDLDDSLSLINLFNILPKHELHNITIDMTEVSKRLNKEFLLFLALSQGIKRAFISIKGFYLNTEIMGVDIIWLVPFNIPQKLPFEIDYEVMTSFLELYQTTLKFVNFKLFKDLAIEYPPPLDNVELPFFGYNSTTIRELQDNIKQQQSSDNKEEDEQDFNNLENSEEMKRIKEKNERMTKIKNLFKPYVFYISREVPRDIFGLVILSCGGVYGDNSDESSFAENDSKITHYVVDRPYENLNIIKNKEYIQPQWIFDCLNAAEILPTSDYGPQKKITIKDKVTKQMRTEISKLPPHMSPFYEHSEEEEIKYKTKDLNRRNIEDDEENELKELQKIKKKPTENKADDKEISDEQLDKNISSEAKELKEMLLSNNKKKLLQKIRDENQRKCKKRKI